MRKLNLLEKDTLKFLKDNLTAFVATCFEGMPHGSVVYFDVDEYFRFYYLTKTNTQKNIQAAFNPNVAIVVGSGPERISVRVRGKAEVLTGEDRQEALNQMSERFSKNNIKNLPIHVMKSLKDKSMVAYRIVPEELVFMNLDSKKYPKSQSDVYHKII
jgi:uncharacterized pyridoxamine 5'-phosphate oxidase family protein